MEWNGNRIGIDWNDMICSVSDTCIVLLHVLVGGFRVKGVRDERGAGFSEDGWMALGQMRSWIVRFSILVFGSL